MKLFGIDTINIVPGAIKSNIGNSAIASYSKLPELKLYKAFDEKVRARALLSQSPRSTPSEEFARAAAEVILRENPPAWFTYGPLSTTMAILYHMPIFLKDFLMRKIMKL